MRNVCDRCDAPLIEIDHYGDRLKGCIECKSGRRQECVRGGVVGRGHRGAAGGSASAAGGTTASINSDLSALRASDD